MKVNIPFYGKLIIVILLTLALAEISPEVVNVFLALVLVGVVLSNWPAFQFITGILETIGK